MLFPFAAGKGLVRARRVTGNPRYALSDAANDVCVTARVGLLLWGIALTGVCFMSAAGGATGAASACRMPQFALHLGPYVSEATGQHSLALKLVNRSGSVCFFDGYPSVSLRDRTGVLPFVITHRGDQMVTSHRPTRFLVAPGRSAFVLLNHYRCDHGGLRGAARVIIGVAETHPAAAIVLKVTDPYRTLSYCGAGDPGSTVAVSPFAPTLRATLVG